MPEIVWVKIVGYSADWTNPDGVEALSDTFAAYRQSCHANLSGKLRKPLAYISVTDPYKALSSPDQSPNFHHRAKPLNTRRHRERVIPHYAHSYFINDPDRQTSVAKPTILLVHGAWHGSWCWKYQIPELANLGYETETLDLPSVSGVPGKTQADDAAHVRSYLETLIAAGKHVIVLGHSYGGPIASAAVAGLAPSREAETEPQGGLLGFIVLCGYIFPGGMDQGAVIKSLGGLPYVNWDTPSEGLFVGNDPVNMLYQPDMPEDLVQWALPQLRAQSMVANMGIVPPQAWQEDGFKGFMGYVHATDDGAISIAEQKAMVEGAGGAASWSVRTLEGSGHSPQIARPKEVAAAIDSIVKDFDKKLAD